MELNIEQASYFISLLTGSIDNAVTWQVFYDPKDGTTRPDLAKVWTANFNDSLEYIRYMQSQMCGVYVTVNETDGKGREESNILKYRAFFADYDGMAEPQWPITPHFTTSRDDTHGHAFWLIDDNEIVTPSEWISIQKRISLATGSDSQVVDPSRVLRLAGSLHLKDPQSPKMYTVTSDGTKSIAKYTLEQVVSAFTLDATKDALLNNWVSQREGIQQGIGYEENPVYHKRFVNWISTVAPIAAIGSGSNTVYRVASYAHDHAIKLEDCKRLMWEHYNQRCMPPWAEVERNHFNDIISRAYHYAKSAAGCKTAKAGFKTLGTLPEPVDGWEANNKINQDKPFDISIAPVIQADDFQHLEDHAEGDRLTHEEAKLLSAQITQKTGHYDLARVFDGVVFGGFRLVRSKKIFYIYTGRNWEQIDDEIIETKVQQFYAQFKPNDTFTKGVYRVLCTLVGSDKELVNGTWLKDVYGLPAAYMVAFRNGIVDISQKTPKLLPHTHNYFNFASLDYDYNPNAKCPVFEKFLDSMWSYDQGLIFQLQQWLGYCLTTENKFQKFALLNGKSRGGKGVLTSIIRQLVGEHNVAAPSLAKLHTDSTKHELSQATVSLIPDAHNVPLNRRDEVLSELKAQTGNDVVSFHVMYKGSRSQVLKCHHILSTNNFPEFIDSSGALVNRMLVFPITRSFRGREDFSLTDKLKAEIEGIAQWAIRGLHALLEQDKFIEASSSLSEKQELKEDMFPLSKFVHNMCTVSPALTADADTLYSAYRMWASLNGVMRPMMEGQFIKTLRNSDLDINKVRVDGESGYFVGLAIKESIAENMNVGNIAKFPPVKA